MGELPKEDEGQPGSMVCAYVCVLACTHKLQRTGSAFQDAHRQRRHQEQQRSFSATLAGLLNEGFTFVGEEIDSNHESVARGLAVRSGCSYSIIEMPMDERKENGCPPDYATLHLVDGSQADVLRCHRLREQYMCRSVLECLSDGQRGLVLCGNDHAARLRNDLAKVFTNVELKSLADYPWFDKRLYEWPA